MPVRDPRATRDPFKTRQDAGRGLAPAIVLVAGLVAIGLLAATIEPPDEVLLVLVFVVVASMVVADLMFGN